MWEYLCVLCFLHPWYSVLVTGGELGSMLHRQDEDSVDPKSLRGDCQIPAFGLDLAIQAEQNWIY